MYNVTVSVAGGPAPLDAPLHALSNLVVPLLPTILVASAVNGTQMFMEGKTPYKFARFNKPILTYLGVPQNVIDSIWDFPQSFKDKWISTIRWLVESVAAWLIPPVFGAATRKWLAEGIVYSYIMLATFIVTFFPQFLFYRAADKYGFLNRWKTNPYRENPDKATEQKIWNSLWPSVLYSFPTETLILWAINHGRGEMAMYHVPSFADVCIKSFITLFIADTLYFFLHWYEHQPGIYAKVHKAHHNIRWLNVYAFFYQTKTERYLLRLNSLIGNLILAYTFGNDLPSAITGAMFFISSDIHIHTGYTVPFFPMNWWNPQYFHDFHHSQNAGNYSAFFGGTPFSWDYWMGTDKNWRRFRKNGGPVRLHRNTWPGFAVEGDLELAKKAAEKFSKEDDQAVIDGKGKAE